MALKTSFAFLFAFLFPFVISKNCKTLDGIWYNDVGSQIYLKHSSDGKLVGKYKTAEERSNGAAGTGEVIFGKLLIIVLNFCINI